uniref:hypothetical protein n=1 Tax=Lachnoclostridium phocaeense TaxID=1871021 RepID=UPI0026DDC207|nr:hypothetical protein [Lachnoclostridium phocaeense]
MDYKELTYKQLHLGQKIDRISSQGWHESGKSYVIEANAGYVTVAQWSPDGPRKRYDSEDTLFYVQLTEEEFRQKYDSLAKKLVKDIQNRMSKDEIGPHDMYNAWLSSDPWEMAAECKRKDLDVLGHCPDIFPKRTGYGSVLDAGVCVADKKTGERFWCHFSMKGIQTLTRRYERRQAWLNEPSEDIETLEYELTDMPYILEEERVQEEERKQKCVPPDETELFTHLMITPEEEYLLPYDLEEIKEWKKNRVTQFRVKTDWLQKEIAKKYGTVAQFLKGYTWDESQEIFCKAAEEQQIREKWYVLR